MNRIKRDGKRLLSIVMVVCMLISLLSFSASAYASTMAIRVVDKAGVVQIIKTLTYSDGQFWDGDMNSGLVTDFRETTEEGYIAFTGKTGSDKILAVLETGILIEDLIDYAETLTGFNLRGETVVQAVGSGEYLVPSSSTTYDNSFWKQTRYYYPDWFRNKAVSDYTGDEAGLEVPAALLLKGARCTSNNDTIESLLAKSSEEQGLRVYIGQVQGGNPSENNLGSYSASGVTAMVFRPVYKNITINADNATITTGDGYFKAAKGELVALTVDVDDGYTMDSIAISDASGSIAVTDNEDGTYSFTMPGEPVTVTVSVTEEQGNPGGGVISASQTITAGGEYYLAPGAANLSITVETDEEVIIVGNGASATDTANQGISIDCTLDYTQLTLRDMFINTAYTNRNVLNFTGVGNVLKFEGTNNLYTASGTNNYALIHVGPDAGLTIADGGGVAYLFKGGAATMIGGNNAESNGLITIEGGAIFGVGSNNGPLIGAGAGATAGTVNITGGTINLMGWATGAIFGNNGNVNIFGGDINLHVNWSGPAISGGTATITGGSLRVFANGNGISYWGGGNYGPRDNPITATKVNGDGNPVYRLVFGTEQLANTSTIFDVAVDGDDFYYGVRHNYTTISEATSQSASGPGNWTASSDTNLYLYLTGENHVLTVNGETFKYAWDADSLSFALDDSGDDPDPLEPDVWDGTADTLWYNTSDTAFTISTAEQLAGLAKLVNDATDDFAGKTVVLVNDLNLNGYYWSPVGQSEYSDNTEIVSRSFAGTFDGGGHTISGLTIGGDDYTSGAGKYNEGNALFGTNAGTIRNVNMKDVSINTYRRGAAITGKNRGLVENCISSGTINANGGGGDRGTGGIVGTNYGTVINCGSTATIYNSYRRAGGIVGYNSGAASLIENCWFAGYASSTSATFSGGIAATNEGTVVNCYWLVGSCADNVGIGLNTGAGKGTTATFNADGKLTSDGETTLLAALNTNGRAWIADPNGGAFPLLRSFYPDDSTFTGIEKMSDPVTLSYVAGQYFDLTGFVVKAAYSDNTYDPITDITVSITEPLTVLDTQVTITAAYEGVTESYVYDITVVGDTFDSIAVTTQPAKTSYANGESFDTAGMVVTAYYSNNTTKVVTDYTYEPTGALTPEDTQIRITYTEDGVTHTTTVAIEVAASAAPTQNEDGYYEIFTLDDLLWIVNQVNNVGDKSINVILMNDIDASAIAWTPIGLSAAANRYAGTFDGDGRTVTINAQGTTSYQGFFGYIENATVKDLTVAGSVTGTGGYKAGIAGFALTSMITDCVNMATVSGAGNVAGIVGYSNNNTIMNSSNKGNINGTTYVGGIVGYANTGSYIGCTNYGAIVNTGTNTGGILGYTSSTTNITNCVNEGTVSGTYEIGGITGKSSESAVYDGCVNKGAVNATSYNVGGLIGSASGWNSTNAVIVTNSVNYGTVTTTDSNTVLSTRATGGLIGYISYVKVSNCFNAGNIYSGSISTGGLIGAVGFGDGNNVISNCYNTGSVTSTNAGLGTSGTSTASAGGLIGYLDDSTARFQNCYNAGAMTYTGMNNYYGGVIGYARVANINFTNNYYLDTTANKAAGDSVTVYTDADIASVTASELLTLASRLGDAYKNGENHPIFTWQPDEVDPIVVDKASLDAQITAAESLVESDYTADTWAVLAQALAVAQAIVVDDGATQVEVDAAAAALEAAIDALVPAPTPTASDFIYEIETAADNYNVGDEVSMNVYISSEVYDTLGGVQFTVSYDTSKLIYMDAVNTISGLTPTGNSAEGAIELSRSGVQINLSEKTLVATLKFKVVCGFEDSDTAAVSLSKTMASPYKLDGKLYDVTTGEAAEISVHNLTVTFEAGTGVVMDTATAYVKYGESALYTDNSYTNPFAVPVPVAAPGYLLADPVWGYTPGTVFTESMVYTAAATLQLYCFTVPAGVTIISGAEYNSEDGKWYATCGVDVTFSVDAAGAGYAPLVSVIIGGVETELEAVGGVYTIPGGMITDDAEIILSYVVDGVVTFIENDQYNALVDGTKILVLTLNGDAIENATYTYDGAAMFWSSEYKAYVTIVDVDVTVADALADIHAVAGESSENIAIVYWSGDIYTPFGVINIYDVQALYLLYSGEYIEDYDVFDMLIRLTADVNGDGTVNSLDAQYTFANMN